MFFTFIIGTIFALPQDFPWQSWPPQTNAHALYVMTNDVSGNEVVAMSVDSNGNISGGKHYATGGLGGNYVDPVTGEPDFPDALSAQDAVVRAGNVNLIIQTHMSDNTC